MLTVIAKLRIKAGQEPAFLAAAEQMLAYVKASEPGTLTYTLSRSLADPLEFVFVERYTDQAAFAAHGGSAAAQQFFGAMGGLLDGRPDMSMYEELAAKA